MILQLNHLQAKAAASTTQEVVAALFALLDEGHIDQTQFAHIQVQLDWVQYKHNFREMVSASRPLCDHHREQTSILDIRVDARQIVAAVIKDTLKHETLRAIRDADREPAQESDAILLEGFQSFRRSIAWTFNRTYWSRLKDWETATGKGYDQALPGGSSDGNNDDAISDSVSDFWTLLRDLESRKQLPLEIFILEIGVGSGRRCGRFVQKFMDLDAQRGTQYYPKLRVLMGDYSLETLDMSRPAVKEHIELCSFLALDAINPLKTLNFLRHKILYVHSSNMYDNLPDEEVVRRDGRLYFVHARAFLPAREAHKLADAFDMPVGNIRSVIERLLEGRKDYLGDPARGMQFWMQLWPAIKLEERLVALEDLRDDPFPSGLDASKLDDSLEEAPADLRFHLSSGALESFTNTLPLLHPRGYLQVQDIFVKDFNEYRLGFFGPGKLDGSIVNWVNGALLKEVAERAGYNVRFAPYRYRQNSKTSILYTTPRE
jgi:hypothetical protein